MKNHKKIIVGCLFIILIGCVGSYLFLNYMVQKRSAKENINIKIGVSIYDEYDSYIAKMVEGLNGWVKEKEQETGVSISLDVVTAGGSQLIQNDQIEDFADKDYDVVCINLVDRTDAAVVIDKAKSADMPIIFFNRELVEEDLERWDKIYYVGAVASESGVMQGQIIINACEERFSEIDKNQDGILQYVILEGEAGHQDALVRTESVVSTLTNAGYNMQKLGDEIANWNRAQSHTKMTTFIEKYGTEIELVIANDDDMALGALDAMEDSNLENFPLLVGVNGCEEALEKVKSKELEGTVFNDYINQTKAIIDMAYSLSLNQAFPEDIEVTNEKYVYIPYAIIDYQNVQEYIRKFY